MIKLIKKIRNTVGIISILEKRLQYIQESLGRLEYNLSLISNVKNLHSREFRVYSQWGEDGILQFLINNVHIDNKYFVEFGVENYTESNTRFLMINDNWSGLIIDGSSNNIDYIKKDRIYWQYDLKASCNFITKENINKILVDNGVTGSIGLLSIDIDGNDYWVWDAINVITPAIVVVEYNARFGPINAVTVPYDSEFVRTNKHHSTIYYGASLAALTSLAHKKGYALIGCNSSGNNAFYIRRDLMNANLKELGVQEAFVRNKFRESRDASGNLIFMSIEEERRLLSVLPLIDVTNN